MPRNAKKPVAPAEPMNEVDINKRLSALVVAMMAKGLSAPDAQLWFGANASPIVYMNWKNPSAPMHADYSVRNPSASARGDTSTDALEKAGAIISAMPGRDERLFNEFMVAVANAVDIGRKNGIDVEFVNPLAETMKRLSENALTFQPAA